MINKLNFIRIVAVAGLVVLGCTRKWDDHNNPGDGKTTVDNNLYQKIAATPSLSTFATYLKQTGYADTLALSKNFTVWAPSDEALKGLGTAVTGNAAALKTFVAHHIAVAALKASDVQSSEVRVLLLNGKYALWGKGAFEGAALTGKDEAVANGILHTIGDVAAPRGNCWDYIDTLSAAGNNMAHYVKSREYKVRDLTNAVQVGVDPVTGAPVYQAGTDSVIRNKLLTEVYDLKNEGRQYTVFVLGNTAFSDDVNSLNRFYVTGTADSTADLCQWNVAKDLVVDTLYTPGNLPDSITSKSGVRVAVNKLAVTAAYKASNGYVYVMNEMKTKIESKIPDIVIQGEKYAGVRNTTNSVFTRTLVDTSRGGLYTDVFVFKHQVNQFYLYYRADNVPTATYKVYWRVINNTGVLANPYVQRLAIGSTTNTTFPYMNITPDNYNEVYLGEYKVGSYGNGTLNMFLVSANITPTASNHTQNSLLLDYIRLVPTR